MLKSYNIGRNDAFELAELFNKNNSIPTNYTADSIIKHMKNGVYFTWLCDTTTNDKIVGAVGMKISSWYQTELMYLVVDKSFRRKGTGKKLVAMAEREAMAEYKSIVMQCMIGEENYETRGLLSACGWKEVNIIDAGSMQSIIVQKILS